MNKSCMTYGIHMNKSITAHMNKSIMAHMNKS